MEKPQIIVTPAGEELVVIPRADYEALIQAASDAEEDAADAAIYDARKAELDAGAVDRLPAEVSAAMLRGDSLLRALRKWRGVKQLELVERTGLGQGYISDLESGRRKGTDETLAQIAKALGVDAKWLIG